MIANMSIVSRFLGYTDLDLDVAAIVRPPGDFHEDYDLHDWLEQLEDHAAWVQAMTRTFVDTGEDDPLIAQLSMLRHQRDQLDQNMRLLVTYMREKVTPRPYTLQQIATATGMSISGVRTFYDEKDSATLEQRITYAKTELAAAHAQQGTTPGKPTIPLAPGENSTINLAADGTAIPATRPDNNPDGDPA